MFRFAKLYATVALMLPLGALAQAPVKVPGGRPFEHKNSGLKLPPTLAGLPRTTVVDLMAPQLDVTTNYATSDNSEALTVYIYRTTAGAVPVWFDRAVWQIEHRPIYGTPVRSEGAPSFAPPGQSAQSGMIAAWTTTGSQYRSTALALVPVGEWLVKFRYSSATMDAPTLTAKLRAAVEAIGWPRAIPPAPAAAPVLSCATPLAFSGQAVPLKRNKDAAFQDALVSGLFGIAQGKRRPGVVWCSDPAPAPSGAVYRAGESKDSYLLALSDAGRGIRVGPDNGAALLDKAAVPGWSIELVLPGRTVGYSPVDRLPSPDAVLAIVQGPRLVTTSTWGKKREISVSPDLVK